MRIRAGWNGTDYRSMHRSVHCMALCVLGTGLLAAGVAGCGSPPATTSNSDDVTDGAPPVPDHIAARRVGPIEFREYDGDVAGDSRLAGVIDRLAATVPGAVNVTEERAGLAFMAERRGAVFLVDDDIRPSGEVTTRIVEGVRRSVIRISARRLVSGEFLPEVHFPPLVVEAAVLAAAGERIAPAWLRAGLATEVGGVFERVLYQRVLGGASVRTQATALFPPTPSGNDPLVAGARVRALARVARGERALARFVTTRLAGTTDADALADVGVHDEDFLDAAAETERDRALASVQQAESLELLARAREALVTGEASRGIPIAALLGKRIDEGRVSDWIATDARITLADYRLRAGDAAAARTLLATALADRTLVVRLREARLLDARAAAAEGDARAAASLYRDYSTDYPGTEGAAEALRAIGIDPELVARLPGIVEEITSDDAAVRRRAALRLGETGDEAAAAPLRQLASDDDPDVRRVALSGLALVLGERAASELELGTFDPSPDVRGAALGMLAFADAARGEARAQALAGDPAPEVRSVVDRILAPSRERESAKVDAARIEEARLEEERARRAREDAGRAAAESAKPPTPDPPKPVTRRPGDPLPPPKPPRPLPAPKDDENRGR